MTDHSDDPTIKTKGPPGSHFRASPSGAPADAGRIGTELVGRAAYRLEELLGRGSSGHVYLASISAPPASGDPLPERVAVKVLVLPHEWIDETCRAEIGLLQAVRHPNVVQLHDWRFDPDAKFTVLDYYPRGSVADLVAKDGPVPIEQATRLLADMLGALVEAHGRGILHLDIKPANVLIGEDGRYSLTDFGIGSAMFQEGEDNIVGTPAYMAPEQARGENASLDARSDLFALGATLWHVLSGQAPCGGQSTMEILSRRTRQSFPSLADTVPESHRELAAIVDRLLAFEPRKRPGGAAEVLVEVERLSGSGGADVVTKAGWPLPEEMRQALQQDVSDPLLMELLDAQATFLDLRLFQDGEVICAEDEKTFDVYVLLHGAVDVTRRGRPLGAESREGAVLGEVSALVGTPRTASVQARGDTVLAILNGAELEQAARRMPALAVRIMKSLARRMAERDAWEVED